jgi:hypothetical protein
MKQYQKKYKEKGSKSKLKSKIIYDKTVARSLHDLRYYESEQDRIKNLGKYPKYIKKS